MASTFLRESVSANGNKKKWTISVWVKRSGLGANTIMSAWYADSTSGHMSFGFDSNDRLDLSTWSTNVLTTNRKFRDTNAWYHIQLAVDTDESTADYRARMYVNGVEETSFSTRNNKSSGFEYSVNNSSSTHNIGGNLYSGTTNLFNGSMSHFHFIDGQQYAPTVFGSTDSTTGEWKINTAPTATYGTNGFFILKDGNSVTDQSGQGNNLTVQAGTLTKTEDCPSNVFATLNPLANANTSGLTLSNGNNTLVTPSGGHDFSISTLGMPSGNGKFYCEVKVSSSANFNMIGISDHMYQGSNQELSEDNYSYGYYSDSGGGSTSGVVRGNGSNILTGMPNYTTNDIIGIAIDLENHKLYFSKNGTWINSGDPTSGSTGTGAVSINNLNTTPNTDARGQGAYFFGVSDWTTSSGGTYQCNFGNGYFGTTAVSSAGTNASNLGIFEYDVPTGFTALSTKGLNE